MTNDAITWAQSATEKHAATVPQQTWYLLIDGSQFETVPAQLHASNFCRYLFQDMEEFAHLDGAGPWLLQTRTLNETKQALQIWLNQSVHAVTWMCTSLGLDALASHWKRQLKVKLANESVMTFRFYDTRVANAVLRQFTPAQYQRYYSAIGVVFWFHGDQLLLGKGPCVADLQATPYVLTQEQQDKVAQLLLPYTVLDELQGIQPEMLKLYSEAERTEGIQTLVTTAQSYGLTTLNELVAFASLGFDFDLKFYEHPQVKEALQNIARGRTLEEALSTVPEDVWDSLAEKNAARKNELAI